MLVNKLWILEWLYRHVPCLLHCNAYSICGGKLSAKNVSLFVSLLKGWDPVVAIVLHCIFCIAYI